MIVTAKLDQDEIERVELVGKPLDAAKVELFVTAVADGWHEFRALPDLATRSGLEVSQVPSSEWTGDRLGSEPLLDPKGLFVTRTNWVGLETTVVNVAIGLRKARSQQL